VRAFFLPLYAVALAAMTLAPASVRAQADSSGPVIPIRAEVKAERWRDEPMPAGIHVEPTELEGPVFADAAGRTLYTWPQHKLRNGYSGEAPGTPACTYEILTVTAGLMSPYPPGIELPELDRRRSCAELWPPVPAPEQAGPVGKWTAIERADGTWQWAYDEQPLYTSIRDSAPGDTLGGSRRRSSGDSPAGRVPAGPKPLLPPGFAVKTTSIGRMLTTSANAAVYAREDESSAEIRCREACTTRWQPLEAPALARELGEWTVIDRGAGERQWAFRDQPLYTHRLDTENWSQEGSDEPGWYNVFTQRVPQPPAGFTARDTIAGRVLADRRGRTVYIYRCGEDSQDQLACDHPDDTQVYRLAICGGGDAELCRERWPYVEAGPDARSDSRAWAARWIDPATGRFAEAQDAGALRVWTYRERPVYTYFLDREAGDVHGSGIGEWRGKRNGLIAFWLRDDFMQGIE
jgi:predicted lipoprotein with Yx(FWY)xxD motif